MIKYGVRDNQNLIDVCLQEYGSLDQLVNLCNDNVKSINSDLITHELLAVDETLIIKNVAGFFSLNELTIATGEVITVSITADSDEWSADSDEITADQI